MQKQIHAVIFDMDGVLVDSTEKWRTVSEDFLTSSIRGWRPEYNNEVIGLGMHDVFKVLKEKYGAEFSEGEFWDFSDRAALDIYERQVSLISGVHRLLENLRDHRVPLAVASSAPGKWVQIVLSRFELLPVFQTVVTADHVTRCKPAPDIFLKAAEQLKVNPSHCLVVEDSLSGIQAAKAAGMYCMAITTSLSREALVLADSIVENFDHCSWHSVSNFFPQQLFSLTTEKVILE